MRKRKIMTEILKVWDVVGQALSSFNISKSIKNYPYDVQNSLQDAVEYGQNMYDILEGADALIIATEWNEFRTPDLEKVADLMKNKAVFDGRNLFPVEEMEEAGFYYISIGRRKINNRA